MEVGLRLDGTPALVEAIRYFRHAMACSNQVFDPRPTQQSMGQRLADRWRKPWPLGPRLQVRAETACWRDLLACAQPPVLWLQSGPGQIDLLAGSSCFRLGDPDEHGVRALSPGEGPGPAAPAVLQEWLTARRPAKGSDGEPSPRGFCPAVIDRVAAPLTRSGRKIVCACARRDGTMSYALGARDRS